MLRDDDAGAGRQADEKAHDQINDDQIRAADGGQRRLADQTTASTMEYSCWSSDPSMIGRKKRVIFEKTGP